MSTSDSEEPALKKAKVETVAGAVPVPVATAPPAVVSSGFSFPQWPVRLLRRLRSSSRRRGGGVTYLLQ